MFSLLLPLIYICFISLGLPDSLLGAGWPVMQGELGVPLSYAGLVSMVICIFTIVSSFLSDRLVRKLGAGRITAISIALTAGALFGFSISNRFWMLILWAIPYGFGAGGVDAVLNNYVALHYKPQHMSWLHCFWGLGATISPFIMSYALTNLKSWNDGYRIVSVIQGVLAVLVFLSLPLWKRGGKGADDGESVGEPLSVRQILAIPGAKACFLMFFGYCALELSSTLWVSVYLTGAKGIAPETASAFAGMVYIGITAGRAVNGFLAMKWSDRTLIRLGLGITGAGILLLFLPFGTVPALVGFILIGLGCAPIYPCIIHMTPDTFGRERSQSMIGVQMGFAYIGFCTMPPLFGWIAERFTVALLPLYLLLLTATVAVMHEIVVRRAKG